MEKTTTPLKILRNSAHTFLTHLHHFSSSPALLALPFSLSLLLHLSSASSAAAALHRRLLAVLLAAGFPLSSPASHFLLLKFSQTLLSSLTSLPFSFSFLLLSKSFTLQSLSNPLKSPFFPLLLTHACNLFLLIAANSACFATLFLAFGYLPLPAWVSAAGAVLYSVVVAHAIVISNLALVTSGVEGKGGLSAILRACFLIKGKTATALILALPANLLMAMAEVVFRYRIDFSGGERWIWAVAAEAVLIAYIYSVLIVGDTIAWFLFYRSCREEADCWCCEEEEEEEYASDLSKLRYLEQVL